jgi:hypothetical protein
MPSDSPGDIASQENLSLGNLPPDNSQTPKAGSSTHLNFTNYSNTIAVSPTRHLFHPPPLPFPSSPVPCHVPLSPSPKFPSLFPSPFPLHTFPVAAFTNGTSSTPLFPISSRTLNCSAVSPPSKRRIYSSGSKSTPIGFRPNASLCMNSLVASGEGKLSNYKDGGGQSVM